MFGLFFFFFLVPASAYEQAFALSTSLFLYKFSCRFFSKAGGFFFLSENGFFFIFLETSGTGCTLIKKAPQKVKGKGVSLWVRIISGHPFLVQRMTKHERVRLPSFDLNFFPFFFLSSPSLFLA